MQQLTHRREHALPRLVRIDIGQGADGREHLPEGERPVQGADGRGELLVSGHRTGEAGALDQLDEHRVPLPGGEVAALDHALRTDQSGAASDSSSSPSSTSRVCKEAAR